MDNKSDFVKHGSVIDRKRAKKLSREAKIARLEWVIHNMNKVKKARTKKYLKIINKVIQINSG